LIVISDTTRASLNTVTARIARCAELAAPGSVVVQLRDPDLPTRERLRLGERLLQIARGAGQLVVVNDRIDFALLLGADGVHLTEASVDPRDARALFASRRLPAWVSRAWHDPHVDPPEGADAYLLSPIVGARKGREPWGIACLEGAKQRLSKFGNARLYALGGVEETNAAACLEAADGVAVIGAVLDTDDPGPLIAALGIARA
jgi:thiamine-phosphate pyrophosphorylase